MRLRTRVDVRPAGDCGVGSLLPTLPGFWGLNPDHQAFRAGTFIHGNILKKFFYLNFFLKFRNLMTEKFSTFLFFFKFYSSLIQYFPNGASPPSTPPVTPPPTSWFPQIHMPPPLHSPPPEKSKPSRDIKGTWHNKI